MRDYLHISLIFFILTGISFLSLKPISLPSSGLPISYIGHFMIYFFLSGAFMLYFHDKEHDHLDAVILAGLTGLFFELLQSQLAFRTFSYIDIIVNFLGASGLFLELKFPTVHKIVDYEDRMLENLT
ncbi:MAG: VanZ family protein [Candidatus Nanohaloarchaea archaeon]